MTPGRGIFKKIAYWRPKMAPIVQSILAVLAKIAQERIMKPSTIEGVAVATASAVASGITPVEPGTQEYYIMIIVSAGIGLWRVIKKD